MADTNADALRRAADLADITTACEEAYADASREGYADNPTVIASVAALKNAHAELVFADANFSAAKGFFRLTGAVWRADRASRAAQAAYVGLRAAIAQ